MLTCEFVSSRKMQHIAAFLVTLANVVDKTQIALDLIDLRLAMDKSQAEFEDAAGLKPGKLQRIESGQATIDIGDLEAFLIAGGSSLLAYLGQVAMTEELKALDEDRDLVEKFIRAFKIPAKRKSLKVVLDGMFADAKWRAKNRKAVSVQPGAHRGDRSEQ